MMAVSLAGLHGRAICHEGSLSNEFTLSQSGGQFVVCPNPVDDLPVRRVETALALDHLPPERPHELLPAHEPHRPPPVPTVLAELALVDQPLLPHRREVLPVHALPRRLRLVVVHPPRPVELVVQPVPLVGDFAVGVVELPVALHAVVVPLPLVGTAVPVLDAPHPLLAALEFEALVAAVLGLLDDEGALLGGFFVEFEEAAGRVGGCQLLGDGVGEILLGEGLLVGLELDASEFALRKSPFLHSLGLCGREGREDVCLSL